MGMRTRTHKAALGLLALMPLAALAGCSLQLSAGTKDDIGSTAYSLTQVIHNSSTLDLTVVSVTADNGGTVQTGYPTTIKAGTDATFEATNSGNGVQMWVKLSAPTGSTLLVDSDVPKVNPNWSSASIASNIGLSLNSISIGKGDTPTADVTVDTCAGNQNCTTSTSTDPPIVRSTDG
ncbi:hypothetical protein [Leifsonia shinshuensis]|uniref:hypothetical protein n=1 Tax=Leifsonia shinshuensis TaxID=150026 RepID=UPI0028606D20|nr:hypothetical protein [Leifsonia shinshuensis]MDR6972710.1 hypothetical protein [Leifsonia shinshuensis]